MKSCPGILTLIGAGVLYILGQTLGQWAAKDALSTDASVAKKAAKIADWAYYVHWAALAVAVVGAVLYAIAIRGECKDSFKESFDGLRAGQRA